MGRRFALVLLALGSAFGFAAGFASLRWHQQRDWGEHGWAEHGWAGPWGHQGRWDAVAEACVRAAERVQSTPGAPPIAPPAVAPNPAPP